MDDIQFDADLVLDNETFLGADDDWAKLLSPSTLNNCISPHAKSVLGSKLLHKFEGGNNLIDTLLSGDTLNMVNGINTDSNNASGNSDAVKHKNLSLLKKLQNPNLKQLLSVLKSPVGNQSDSSGQSKLDKLVNALVSWNGDKPGKTSQIMDPVEIPSNLRARRNESKPIGSMRQMDLREVINSPRSAVESTSSSSLLNAATLTPMSQSILRSLSTNAFHESPRMPRMFFREYEEVDKDAIILPVDASAQKSVTFEDSDVNAYNMYSSDPSEHQPSDFIPNHPNAYRSLIPPTPKDYVHRAMVANANNVSLQIEQTARYDSQNPNSNSSMKSKKKRKASAITNTSIPRLTGLVEHQPYTSRHDRSGATVGNGMEVVEDNGPVLQENSFIHFYGGHIGTSDMVHPDTLAVPPLPSISNYHIPSFFENPIAMPPTSEWMDAGVSKQPCNDAIPNVAEESIMVNFPFIQPSNMNSQANDIPPLNFDNVLGLIKTMSFSDCCDVFVKYCAEKASVPATSESSSVSSDTMAPNDICLEFIADLWKVSIRRLYDIATVLVYLGYFNKCKRTYQKKLRKIYHWITDRNVLFVRLDAIQKQAISQLRLNYQVPNTNSPVIVIPLASEEQSVLAVPIACNMLDIKCKQFLALFLLGHNYMCVNTAISLIQEYGLFQQEENAFNATNAPEQVGTEGKEESENSTLLKNQVRRLYDIASILCSLGIIGRIELKNSDYVVQYGDAIMGNYCTHILPEVNRIPPWDIAVHGKTKKIAYFYWNL